jgi:hypothetical protein
MEQKFVEVSSRRSALTMALLFFFFIGTMAIFASIQMSSFGETAILKDPAKSLVGKENFSSHPVSKYIRDRAFLYVETTDNWVYANTTRDLLEVQKVNDHAYYRSRSDLDQHYERSLAGC